MGKRDGYLVAVVHLFCFVIVIKAMVSFVFRSCIAHCYHLGAVVWFYVPIMFHFIAPWLPAFMIKLKHFIYSSVLFLSFQQVDDFHEDASTETLEYSFLCNWNIKLVVLCFWQIWMSPIRNFQKQFHRFKDFLHWSTMSSCGVQVLWSVSLFIKPASAVMSAPTSPPTSPRNKSKLMDCKVLLLDDSIITYPIPVSSQIQFCRCFPIILR